MAVPAGFVVEVPVPLSGLPVQPPVGQATVPVLAVVEVQVPVEVSPGQFCATIWLPLVQVVFPPAAEFA